MSIDTLRDGAAAPSEGASAAVPWYRRRAVQLGGGVAVVLAIAVVTDLPTPTSHVADVASARAFVKEVNTDLRPCGLALEEALSFRQDQLRSSLTTSERAMVPSLLSDDAVACSYIDPSVTDLTSLESPQTTAAQPLGEMVATSTVWVTSDALGAVEAIETLWTHPTSAPATAALARWMGRLARDRAKVQASVANANAQLGIHRLGIDLPSVTVPGATSTAP